MARAVRCWILLLCSAPLWAISARAAPLRVALEPDAVVASGVTPKGQVVLFGVSREIGEDDYPTVRRHLELLTDDDGDGVIRYAVEPEVPLRSVWTAVDLTSGDHDASAPARFGLRRVDWRGRGLQRRADGKDAVDDRRARLELLVVRPQAGAWSLRVYDGHTSDGDGTIDGRLEGVLERMEPLAAAPKPPSVFQRDDVVVGIDPASLEITLFKVPQGLQP